MEQKGGDGERGRGGWKEGAEIGEDRREGVSMATERVGAAALLVRGTPRTDGSN